MRYLIIEDEQLPYRALKRMMERLRPDYELAGWATSVEQGSTLLRMAKADLVMSDIKLADGLCFEIFDRVHSDVPIIFTTAYDEYALKAFKLNSVDYLMKPVGEEELEAALSKLERNQLMRTGSETFLQLRQEYMPRQQGCRIVIERKTDKEEEMRAVEADEVALFRSAGKYTTMLPFSGEEEIISYTLEQLEGRLDANRFFRTSRSCIVNIRAISKVVKWFNGGLRVALNCPRQDYVTVARNRRHDFLRWFGA